MSWRDEEYTDMERVLSSEVKRLRSTVRELQEENEMLRSERVNWIDSFVEALPDYSDGNIWTDGDREILVRTESAAEAVADLIELLYRAQGDDISINTGYYDPEEDRKNGETDQYTGWWYINID